MTFHHGLRYDSQALTSVTLHPHGRFPACNGFPTDDARVFH